jgi:hypothetical protein
MKSLKDTANSPLMRAIVIPLIVGILIATVAFALPRIFANRKEVSYSVDGPTSYITAETGAPVSIAVNGVQTPSLFIYRVRVWNSGGTPIVNLPILFSFTPDLPHPFFKIFNLSHATIPQKEFGKIDQTDVDPSSKRCTYGLLNPGDQDTLTFLTSLSAPLQVFAKAEGLTLKTVTQKKGSWSDWKVALVFAVTGTLGSILSEVLWLLFRRKRTA